MKATIYGSSDDNFIIKSDEITDEFGAYSGPRWMEFSDGTLVKGEYSPDGYHGKWKIVAEVTGSKAAIKHTPAPNDDGDYTDRLTVEGDIKFVGCWSEARGPDLDDLDQLMDGMEYSNFTPAQRRSLYLFMQELNRT